MPRSPRRPWALGAIPLLAAAVVGCSPLATPAIESAPPAVQSERPQSPSPTVTTPPPTVPAAERWRTGDQQHGIQVYAHNANGRPADVNIEGILDYIVERGSNSVAYSFPIYTNGQRPTRVYTGPETPTPAVMANLVSAAHERGLRVMLRPLLDEENLRDDADGWRGTIRPPKRGAWFRSYEKTLRPYLEAAATSGAEEFVLATELTSLQRDHRRWKALATAAAEIFPATLSYTFNFDAQDARLVPPKGSAGLDLYFAVDLGPKASVQQLTDALVEQIEAKPKKLRSIMVAQEVGIAAEDGAYRHPWNWGSPDTSALNPTIQVNWFTAACRAVEETGLRGIYFWMVDSSTDPAEIDPRTEGSAGFVGRPAEKAIERCFAQEEKE